MVLVKATEDSETGNLPSAELLAAMGAFNQALVEAGVLQPGGGEGLKPSSQGKRVAFDGADRAVIDGPFGQTRELVAGFWLWEVRDMVEAVAWAKRCANPMPGPSEIEIRPVYELADFAYRVPASGKASGTTLARKARGTLKSNGLSRFTNRHERRTSEEMDVFSMEPMVPMEEWCGFGFPHRGRQPAYRPAACHSARLGRRTGSREVCARRSGGSRAS